MAAPILQIWSAPKCQAGAQVVGTLPATTSGSVTEALEGNTGGSFTVPSDVARAQNVAEGYVVRALIPRRGVREWVITQVDDSDPGTTTTVTVKPLRDLFALRDYARVVSDGAVSLSLGAFVGTPAEFITRAVLVNLAADRLEWLSLGTMEFTAPIQWPAVKVQTRGQLLTLAERLTGGELVVRALPNDTGYVLDLVKQHNIQRAPWVLEVGPTAVSVRRTRALAESATAVRGVGDDDLPMGEVAWVGGAPIGTGPFWIPLTDPTGGPAPIREDGQLAGTWLALPDGSTLAVLTTRQSDSAAQVAALGTYVAGQRVIFWENQTGRPVSLLTSPSALAAPRGLVVARVQVQGGRQERNLVRNGAFETPGLANWAAVGAPAGAEIPRADLGVDFTGQIATARAASTGVGTVLELKAIGAGRRLHRGDSLEVQAVAVSINADALASPTGALSVSVASPGFPASYADNAAFQLVRRDTRTFTLDGPHSPLSPVLRFKNSNTDGLAADGLSSAFTLASTVGQYTANGTNVVYEDQSQGRRAGKILANVAPDSGNTNRSTIDWPTRTADVFNLGFGGATLTGTLNGFPTADVFLAGPALVVGGRVRWYGNNARFQVARVTAVLAVGQYSIVMETDPPFFTGWSGLGLVEGCNVLIPDNAAFTWVQTRDTQTLNLNGPVTAGALSAAFRPVAALARRDWQVGDTITVTRQITATIAWTAAELVEQTVYDEATDSFVFVGYELRLTLNTAASTIDDIPESDFTSPSVAFTFPSSVFGEITWPITGVAGGVARFFGTFGSGSILPTATGSVTNTWLRNESYTVSGAASWGTDGRATVPVTGGIPAGRTYPLGAMVSASWGTLGPARLASPGNPLASGFDVLGVDTWGSFFSGVGPYRIRGTGGSTLPIPGETLRVGAPATASAGGLVNVVLDVPNTTALAADTVVRVVRPQLLAPADARDGHVLRLLFAPGSGTPANSVAAYQSTAERVRVPAGGEVTVTARVVFAITPEALGPGQAPVVAIVDPDTNTMLAWGNIGSTTVTYQANPTELPLVAQVKLSATRRVAVRLYGGSSSVFARWHVVKSAMLYVGTDPDVPYAREGLSLNMWHRCQDVLSLRASAARYSVRALERGALTGAGAPPEVGQPVRLRSAALGVDTLLRATRLVWRWPGAELVDVDVGPLTPKLTDVDVTL